MGNGTEAVPARVVVNKVIGDYEFELRKDERGIVRSYCRLSDSPQYDLKRIAARNLPEELKAVFVRETGCTREQLEI